MTTHEMIDLRIRQARALNSLLLAIACVVLAGLTAHGTVVTRQKVDGAGKPLFTLDGRPLREPDYLAEVMSQPVPYGFLAMAGFFVLRAASIRFRPAPGLK